MAESHKFRSVKYNSSEPFDNFLTELRTIAASCNFGTLENRMIRDKIVFSTYGKIQQLLLRADNLDLPRAIKIGPSYEQANRQALAMRDELNHVHKVVKQPNKGASKSAIG